MKAPKTSISIVIPAYNENKRIRGILRKIIPFLKNKGYVYEIIIVNDGSRDNTSFEVKKFMKVNKRIKLLENEKNMGKGYSVKRGVLNSKYSLILFFRCRPFNTNLGTRQMHSFY